MVQTKYWDGNSWQEVTINMGTMKYWDGTMWVSGIPDSELTQIADHIWFANEGEGDIVADSEGSLDGSISGATWETTAGTDDVFLLLDGTDDIVSFGNVHDSGSLSKAIWCRPDDFSGTTNNAIFGSASSGRREFTVDLNDGEDWRAWCGGDTTTPLASPTEGNWALAALSYDHGAGSADFFAWDINDDVDSPTIDESFSASEPSFSDLLWGHEGALDGYWGGGADYGVMVLDAVGESAFKDHFAETKVLYE